MIIPEKVTEIREILLDAAKNRTTVPFWTFHKLFGDEKENDRYDTLEEASRSLAPLKDAIYSVLLAKKDDNGCPGIGFYDVFLNNRRSEFISITKHTNIHQLREEPHHRKNIADLERDRVYQHAKKHY